MNIDGTNSKRLTHAKNKWDSAPAWTPDAKKLLLQENIKIRKEFGRQTFGL
jgi:TolB protein